MKQLPMSHICVVLLYLAEGSTVKQSSVDTQDDTRSPLLIRDKTRHRKLRNEASINIPQHNFAAKLHHSSKTKYRHRIKTMNGEMRSRLKWETRPYKQNTMANLKAWSTSWESSSPPSNGAWSSSWGTNGGNKGSTSSTGGSNKGGNGGYWSTSGSNKGSTNGGGNGKSGNGGYWSWGTQGGNKGSTSSGGGNNKGGNGGYGSWSTSSGGQNSGGNHGVATTSGNAAGGGWGGGQWSVGGGNLGGTVGNTGGSTGHQWGTAAGGNSAGGGGNSAGGGGNSAGGGGNSAGVGGNSAGGGGNSAVVGGQNSGGNHAVATTSGNVAGGGWGGGQWSVGGGNLGGTVGNTGGSTGHQWGTAAGGNSAGGGSNSVGGGGNSAGVGGNSAGGGGNSAGVGGNSAGGGGNSAGGGGNSAGVGGNSAGGGGNSAGVGGNSAGGGGNSAGGGASLGGAVGGNTGRLIGHQWGAAAGGISSGGIGGGISLNLGRTGNGGYLSAKGKFVFSQRLKEYQNDVLQTHNKYRKIHKARALTLTKGLSKVAMAYARTLANKVKKIKHSEAFENVGVGENLLMSAVPITGATVVKTWYDQVYDYDFNKHKGRNEAPYSAFTQVVWKRTRRIGVGRAVGKVEGHMFVFYCVRYKPTGYVGKIKNFRRNVKRGGYRGKGGQLGIAGGSGGSGAMENLQTFTMSALSNHNMLRNLHGVPALTLDGNLSEEAFRKSNPEDSSDIVRSEAGMNVFDICQGIMSGAGVTKEWYKDACFYDFEKQDSLRETKSQFRQVIWKDSKKFGISYKVYHDEKKTCVRIIALYTPAMEEANINLNDQVKKGNFIGCQNGLFTYKGGITVSQCS